MTSHPISGIKHLEEFKDARYEMPTVNQIEVQILILIDIRTHRHTDEHNICFIQLHPFCQQKSIVEYCRANAIVVQAYCPILRGKMDDPVITKLAEKVLERPAPSTT